MAEEKKKFNEKKNFFFLTCRMHDEYSWKDIRKLKMSRFVYWNIHESVCLDRMRMTKKHILKLRVVEFDDAVCKMWKFNEFLKWKFRVHFIRS